MSSAQDGPARADQPAAPGPFPQADPLAQVVAGLDNAARRAGIAPDTPMGPPLAANIALIRATATGLAALGRNTTAAAGSMTDALTGAHASALAERDRFRHAGKSARDATGAGLAAIIPSIAQRAIERHSMVFRHNKAFLAGFLLFLAAIAGFGTGYGWSHGATLAAVRTTEAGLRTAFARHPEADAWARVMRWNHLKDALDQCAYFWRTHVRDGRKTCNVHFWVEPSDDPESPVEQPSTPKPPKPAPTPQAPPPPPPPFDFMAPIRPRPGSMHFGP